MWPKRPGHLEKTLLSLWFCEISLFPAQQDNSISDLPSHVYVFLRNHRFLTSGYSKIVWCKYLGLSWFTADDKLLFLLLFLFFKLAILLIQVI